jgi:hypothetical protein
MPWLAIGDFNEILYHHEKEGGRSRAQVHLQAFQDALTDCELADIGFSGDEFTWQRGRIRERLDRGTANAGWNTLFPNAQLINGEMVKSDHRPLIVNTEGCSSFALPRSGPRRFEARWLKEETVEEIVQAAWARAAARGHGPKLMSKVKAVHADMHEWDKNVLKKPAQRMKKLKQELETLRWGPMTDASLAAQKEILLRLELLLEQEEIIWVQRARANWLKHGDHNTNFFHHYASARKRRNMVKGLVDDQGVRHENIEEMSSMVRDYFANLFSSEVREVDQDVLGDVSRRVTR